MGFVFLLITTIVKKHYDKLYSNCTESIIGIFDRLTERLGTNDIDDIRNYYPIYKYIVNGQEYYCKGHTGTYYKKDVDIENTIMMY